MESYSICPFGIALFYLFNVMSSTFTRAVLYVRISFPFKGK